MEVIAPATSNAKKSGPNDFAGRNRQEYLRQRDECELRPRCGVVPERKDGREDRHPCQNRDRGIAQDNRARPPLPQVVCRKGNCRRSRRPTFPPLTRKRPAPSRQGTRQIAATRSSRARRGRQDPLPRRAGTTPTPRGPARGLASNGHQELCWRIRSRDGPRASPPAPSPPPSRPARSPVHRHPRNKAFEEAAVSASASRRPQRSIDRRRRSTSAPSPPPRRSRPGSGTPRKRRHPQRSAIVCPAPALRRTRPRRPAAQRGRPPVPPKPSGNPTRTTAAK